MKNPHVVSLLVLLVLLFSIFTCNSAQSNSANTLSDTIAHPSGIHLLKSMENASVSIAERGSPAVVSITVLDGKRKGVHAWERNFDRRDGTGFIFRKDGYILTNDHVVNGAKQIIVRLFGDRAFKDVPLVGTDPTNDIAVLKINTTEELTPLPLAGSDQVKVGQFAIAIGNPFQLDYTVTTGIISGKGRSLLPDSADLKMKT